MNNLISINNADLTIKEYQGQRVITFKDIDMVHGRPEGTAKRNFTDNRQHFLYGEDYFKICPNEIRSNKIMDIPPKLHQDVVFLTESGYLMLVKSFTDDLAWQVQRELVNTYFRKQEKPQQLQPGEKIAYEYQPKFYKGVPVVTTADIEHFTKIPCSTVTYYLRSHRKYFKEGLDYWFLTGLDLRDFKVSNSPWCSFAKSLIIFTETGVKKLSELILDMPAKLECMQSEKEPPINDMHQFLEETFDEIKAIEAILRKIDRYNTPGENKMYLEVLNGMMKSLNGRCSTIAVYSLYDMDRNCRIFETKKYLTLEEQAEHLKVLGLDATKHAAYKFSDDDFISVIS